MKPMFKDLANVVVATDLSRGAEHALQRAVRLPLAPDAEVLLLHVLPEEIPRSLRAQAEEGARSRLRELSAAAAGVAQRVGVSGLSITPRVVSGEAYVEIIRNARTTGAELVVVGRHGKKGIRSLMIGSTAMRVIRKGELPVLIVGREPSGPYCRPLVAASLEDTDRAVLDLAFRVLGSGVASVPVVHAYWPPFEGAILAKLTPKELAEYHRSFQRKAEAGLNKILAALPDKGARCKPVVLRGDPRSVVLEESDQRRSDLIVVGTHARSGASHILLGSVAEWLISKARCDVLVARPAHFSFRLP